MSMFTWKEQYKIGVAAIDAQHQQLFDLANQIVEATDANEVTRLVMLFFKHVREHFQLEEEIMKQHQYPDYAMHVEAHNLMLDQLIDLSKIVQSKQWTLNDIQAFVNDWLLVHILEVDMMFGKYLKQHGRT